MKKKIGKKTTFQITEKEKDFLSNKAEDMNVSISALIRGIIRLNKEKV